MSSTAPTDTAPTDDAFLRVLYHTIVNGPYYKVIAFASPAEYGEWAEMEGRIKARIAKINEDKDAGRALMPECNERLTLWLELVFSFALMFGKHKIPLDIRNACHEVQDHLEVEQYDFGPDVGFVDMHDEEDGAGAAAADGTGAANAEEATRRILHLHSGGMFIL